MNLFLNNKNEFLIKPNLTLKCLSVFDLKNSINKNNLFL